MFSPPRCMPGGMAELHGKALITGASGFIGSRLRQTLLDLGLDVVAIRRKGSPPAKVGRSVVADYADAPGLTAIMRDEKPDYVFHVAGATKGIRYEDFQRANVMPTANLLEALREGHPEVQRFVHISSFAAYGPSTSERPVHESDTPAPVEFYGRSKLESEALLAAETRIPWTIIRPAGVYGPGDVDYYELFKMAHFGLNLFFGNRDRSMSVIHVDDCIRAMLEATASENTIGKGYFLADGKPLTWGEFQEIVVRSTQHPALSLNLPEFLVEAAAWGGELAARIDGKPRLLNRQKATMGRQEAWTCTVDEAKKDFGFQAKIFPAQGVPATYRWYKENGWLKLL